MLVIRNHATTIALTVCELEEWDWAETAENAASATRPKANDLNLHISGGSKQTQTSQNAEHDAAYLEDPGGRCLHDASWNSCSSNYYKLAVWCLYVGITIFGLSYCGNYRIT